MYDVADRLGAKKTRRQAEKSEAARLIWCARPTPRPGKRFICREQFRGTPECATERGSSAEKLSAWRAAKLSPFSEARGAEVHGWAATNPEKTRELNKGPACYASRISSRAAMQLFRPQGPNNYIQLGEGVNSAWRSRSKKTLLAHPLKIPRRVERSGTSASEKLRRRLRAGKAGIKKYPSKLSNYILRVALYCF